MEYSNPTGLPSVSDILNPFEDTRWFTESSRRRGTFVHGWIAADLLGMFTPAPPEEFRGYIESYKAFKPHIKEVLLIERRLSSSRGFCGQLDLLATLDETYNNLRTLLDWKTSKVAYVSYTARLGGYSILARENDLDPQAGMLIRLRNEPTKTKGYWPIIDQFDRKELKECEIDFLSCHRVYNNILSNGKLYTSFEQEDF